MKNLIKTWPPKDWRSILALLFSVLGAMALTVLIWSLAQMFLPENGWGQETEADRVMTLQWVMWICSGCVLLVLTGLGFAVNHRRLNGKWGDREINWEGGDQGEIINNIEKGEEYVELVQKSGDDH